MCHIHAIKYVKLLNTHFKVLNPDYLRKHQWVQICTVPFTFLLSLAHKSCHLFTPMPFHTIPVALKSGLKYEITYTALRIPIAVKPVWELSFSHTAGTPEFFC